MDTQTTKQSSNEWVEVGYILRPHGVRGELRVVLHAPEEGFPKSIESVRLVHPKHGEHSAKVDSARKTKDAVLLCLDTVRGRDEAQRWKGSAIFVEAAYLPEPAQGYHVFELVGANVASVDGTPLGTIAGFLDNSAHLLLRVEHEGKELLFPYVEEFIHGFERESDTLVICVPEGLWDEDEGTSES
jgi:16S rRNA processing protein RimM